MQALSERPGGKPVLYDVSCHIEQLMEVYSTRIKDIISSFLSNTSTTHPDRTRRRCTQMPISSPLPPTTSVVSQPQCSRHSSSLLALPVGVHISVSNSLATRSSVHPPPTLAQRRLNSCQSPTAGAASSKLEHYVIVSKTVSLVLKRPARIYRFI